MPLRAGSHRGPLNFLRRAAMPPGRGSSPRDDAVREARLCFGLIIREREIERAHLNVSKRCMEKTDLLILPVLVMYILPSFALF